MDRVVIDIRVLCGHYYFDSSKASDSFKPLDDFTIQVREQRMIVRRFVKLWGYYPLVYAPDWVEGGI